MSTTHHNPYAEMDVELRQRLLSVFQEDLVEALRKESRVLEQLELLRQTGLDVTIPQQPLVRIREGVQRPHPPAALEETTILATTPSVAPVSKKGLIPMPFLSEKGRTVPKRIQNDLFPDLLQHLFDLMARKPQKTWNSRTAADALARRFKIKEDNQLLRTELRRRISIYLQVHYVGSNKNSHQDYWIAEGPDGNRTYRINPAKLPAAETSAPQQPAAEAASQP